MKLKREEQESIISFNEAERVASVYTHNMALRRRLERLAAERPEECRLETLTHEGQAAQYIVPKSWVKIRAPRLLTAVERDELRRRMNTSRLNAKSPQ